MRLENSPAAADHSDHHLDLKRRLSKGAWTSTFCDYFPTGITRKYDMTTDPRALLEDHSLAAERAGWEPISRVRGEPSGP